MLTVTVLSGEPQQTMLTFTVLSGVPQQTMLTVTVLSGKPQQTMLMATQLCQGSHNRLCQWSLNFVMGATADYVNGHSVLSKLTTMYKTVKLTTHTHNKYNGQAMRLCLIYIFMHIFHSKTHKF